jgi:hypothetical protein
LEDITIKKNKFVRKRPVRKERKERKENGRVLQM